MSSSAASTSRAIMNEVRQLIPPLSADLHKGQAGRVAVVGGSADYTGAPYFSAMSSMRLGADMSHNICEPSAGSVIKGYSPDCIVHNWLHVDRSRQDIRKDLDGLCDRLHAMVVGPGLGRDDHMQMCGREAVEAAKAKQLWLVVDADGLWLLQNEPGLVKGYRKAVLTPNVVEFGRLCEKMSIKEEKGSDAAVTALAKALDGPTLLVKGKSDRITNGGKEDMLYGDEAGGLKRCGGQGDVLSGCLGTFLAWISASRAIGHAPKNIPEERLPMLAAFGASSVARRCSHEAFKRQGRAMLAHDMIEEIGKAYEHFFGDPQAAL